MLKIDRSSLSLIALLFCAPLAASAAAEIRSTSAAPASAEDRVKHIIAEQLGVDVAKVQPNARLVELKADELDMVEMCMTLEEEFNKTIPDEQLDNFETVGQVIAYVVHGTLAPVPSDGKSFWAKQEEKEKREYVQALRARAKELRNYCEAMKRITLQEARDPDSLRQLAFNMYPGLRDSTEDAAARWQAVDCNTWDPEPIPGIYIPTRNPTPNPRGFGTLKELKRLEQTPDPARD